MFLQLLDDIKILVLRYLDVRSLLDLSATCHQCRALIADKSVWLDALENMRCKRPIPLAYHEQASRGASADVPLERLRNGVVQAAKIEHNWSKDVIRPTRFKREKFPLKEDSDRLRWVWYLGSSGIVMIYTANNWFTLNLDSTGQSVTFQTGSAATCYDFDVDHEGITLVFNVAENQQEGIMEVHRIQFQDFAHQLVKEVPTRGHIHSNFLEDKIAGCIQSSCGPNYEIIVVDSGTGKYAIINTGIEIKHGRHLTASTTKDRLLMGYEGIGFMVTWWYGQDLLRQCITKASSPEEPCSITVAPQETRRVQFVDQGLPPRLGIRFYPTSRGMWTKRQSVWTVYVTWTGSASFTYAVIPEDPCIGLSVEADEAESSRGAVSFDGAKPKKFAFVSHRSFLYHIPEHALLSSGRGNYYLCDFGHQGKNAVWIEDADGERTCRLATFNHEDDTTDAPVSNATSTIIFEEKGFSWNDMWKIQLDDQSGTLICFTDDEIWRLHFD